MRYPARRKPRKADTIAIRFGYRLFELRTARAWTQDDLCNAFGISRAHYSQLENGNKSPILPMLEVIALGFKITISELMNGL